MPITPATLGLVEQMRAALARLLDGVTRRLTQAWVRSWDDLAEDFVAALDDLLAATGSGRWPTRAQIQRATRLQAALDTTARVLERLAATVRAEATTAARSAADDAAQGQAAIIAGQLPPRLRQTVLAGRFSERALGAIVTRTAGRITALTRPLSRDAMAAIRRELVRGVAVGSNPRDVARRMVRRVEGAFNGGLARALVIARTEVIDANRAAAAAAQQEHSKTLEGWTWLAKLGPDTCAACWSMHGTVYPLSEPGPQGHPQCRCSRAPKTKSWADLGFDIDEPADAIPDAQAAFRALPRADQLKVMGAVRLDLLDRGEIGWADLATRRENPGWRASYVPTPVAGLSRRAA